MNRKKEYARIAEWGCILCRHKEVYDTPAEIHHIRNGGKRENAPVIPLCPEHHRGDVIELSNINYGREGECLMKKLCQANGKYLPRIF
jgi:hypothetical protein